jgi:predicted phosphodiesterase
MKVIKSDLSKDIDSLELHVFADEHIGDYHCDLPRLQERIDYVANTPNAYCILNGDILDFASRSSIGDIETREFNIMEQLERTYELFGPIKDKILCITNGNHEARGYRKEGFDVSRVLASRLNLSDVYTMTAAFIFLRFGENNHNRKQLYTLYVNHGSGGGRKEGAKAIRLADMASVIDADIYIHSHTHLPMVMKQGFHRVDKANSAVANVTKLFVNTASNLNYGGYGEAQEYKPNSKDTPVIHLSGSKREMNATL